MKLRLPAELIPRAEAIAAKIIANAPLAVQYAMEAVNKGMEMTLSEGLYLEAVLFGVACATEDKKEGTTAFLEKRAAAVQGEVNQNLQFTQRSQRIHRVTRANLRRRHESRRRKTRMKFVVETLPSLNCRRRG